MVWMKVSSFRGQRIYLCHVCRAVIITSDMNRIMDYVSDLRV